MLHYGLVVYAHSSLNILSACDEQPKGLNRKIHTTIPLVFGKQQRTVVIMPYSTTIQQTLMKIRSFGEAMVQPPKYLKERYAAMTSMRKRLKRSPGIPNSRCYRYKWVIRGFWDFHLRRQGIRPGISYSKTSKASAGNMTMRDHSLARLLYIMLSSL